jgi:hypothetical protein
MTTDETTDSLRLWTARLYVGVFALGGIGVLGAAVFSPYRSAQSLVYVGFVAYAAVGYAIVSRRTRNAIGWWFLLTSLVGGVFGVAQAVGAVAAETQSLDTWWGFLALWPQNWLWLPLLTCAVTVPILLFPDGRLLSTRWRWVMGIAIGASVFFVALNSVAPVVGSALDGTSRPNPLSPGFLSGAGDPSDWVINTILQLVVAVTAVLAAASVIGRVRRATGIEVLQLRWFLFGACCLLLGLGLNIIGGVVGNALLAVGLAMLPVSMGVAILRYRLYDIDRVISRTVSYAVVTGLALATYAVLVTSASRLLPSGSSPIVVAGATLVAAAMVRPLLRRVQRVVDRRFNRERVDGLREVDAFAERLRSEVDSELVVRDILDVAQRTLGPGSVALWNAGGAR